MLYFALFLSAVLLLLVNLIAFCFRRPVRDIVCLSAAALFAPCFLMASFPPVALQAILLCASAGVWRYSGRGPAFFLALSCASTTAAYGVAGLMAFQGVREYARLRALYPFESMEARVPAPKPRPLKTPPTADTALSLVRQESKIQSSDNSYQRYALIRLHEERVSLFINSAGFGVARMGPGPTAEGLARGGRRVTVPAQPAPRVASDWSPGTLERPPAGDVPALRRMLEGSVMDFASPLDFGYVKDRRHVAGFVPHRFGEVPTGKESWKDTERWKVQTLELVGLLLHDEPVVYVSDRLPRMDKLRAAPTRPPDAFESYALTALQQGESLFAARDGEGMRMLGAVSSLRQCVACHGGERGDLLGAFSYTLRPDTTAGPGGPAVSATLDWP